jgi:1-deoxy-D-xylulose-5-phosphate synthase
MSRYLDMVDAPEHVKKLTVPQLQELAGEIRTELIEGLAKGGGHLGPNLGVVELSIALHKVFNTPKDKFVWDVSHQVYVHKILTGRKNRFRTIRQTDGLNGFALRSESEHDCFGAGHAGTALSAALGMAAARDRRGSNENIVCIFGDAALTNGISFEAMNNISHTTKKFIGILNDNEWSIAKNVGAISGYLNKLITNPRYNQLAKDFESFVRRLPKGELALKLAHRAEGGFKGALTGVGLQQTTRALDADGRGGHGSPVLFEEMGIRYLGPINGHDLPLLVSTLEFAKQCDHPIVIHILTQKGKGFDAALKQPEKFHGLGPYNAQTGETPASKPGTPPAYQDIMGQTMIKLCQKQSNLVGITAAMPTGTGMKHLEKAMPDRYYDVGIAEEHAVIFAAGMATMGFRPVVAIYSTFLQRAYDCIHHDVCLQDLPVIFCMDRAGLSANDGPTHHGLFDISYLRCFPNVVAMAPANEDELADMMLTATTLNHPAFIRYPRGTAEGVPVKAEPQLIEFGKAQIVQSFANNKKRKVALFGLGPMNTIARKAAAQLVADGYDCAVINPRFTKPIDGPAHETYGHEAELAVTIEDHVLMGGYGSSVLELFSEKNVTTPVIRIGWPDQFIEHATTQDELRAKYGLSVENIVNRVKVHFGEAPASVAKLVAVA